METEVHPERLYQLLAEVVKDLDSEGIGGWSIDGTAGVAAETGSGFRVYFRLEGSFQGLVGTLAPRTWAWRTKQLSSLESESVNQQAAGSFYGFTTEGGIVLQTGCVEDMKSRVLRA